MTVRQMLQNLHRLAAELGADTELEIRGLGKTSNIDKVRRRKGKSGSWVGVIVARNTAKNNPAAEEEEKP